jgi:ABC-type Fe3+/spermidine/putrescine transport system ATPase subunit
VASFVGNTNLIPGKVTGRLPDGRLRVQFLGGEILAPTQDGLAPGHSVLISLRPDDLEIIEERDRARHPHVFAGRLRQLVFTGDILRLEVEVAGQIVRIHATGRARFALMESRPETVLFATGELVIIPLGASSEGADDR